ncbi:MBL fold metallo-hydrolase [Novosphingobium rosa]|uniref:MBL fold metallo-hydrolase n=1 Tax=Novosphingobium rosa TaxID=76978 RepID=UPI000835BC02|nr:MBL fold metallo-hydrolase [Novosphingobium rosa]
MPTDPVYTVGKARVARVVDCQIDTFRPTDLMPDWSAAHEALLASLPETLSGDGRRMVLSIHSWVVWLDGRIILIDTGVGNDKPRPFAPYFDRLTTPYLARLAALGVTPEAVDCVLHTHLHVDHVGWNTRLIDGQWRPTFPNARHVFSAREYAFFRDPANVGNRHRTSFQTQQDSVTPIVEAGMADMIEVYGREVIPGFSFHATPGHSADHASIMLESGSAKALFSGDVFHHPVQVLAPDLLSIFDAEREMTLRSRSWALDVAADEGAMLFSAHFPASSAGKVNRHGNGFSWSFA